MSIWFVMWKMSLTAVLFGDVQELACEQSRTGKSVGLVVDQVHSLLAFLVAFLSWNCKKNVEVHLNCSQRKDKNTKLKEFNHKQMRCENEPNVSIGLAKTWREWKDKFSSGSCVIISRRSKPAISMCFVTATNVFPAVITFVLLRPPLCWQCLDLHNQIRQQEMKSWSSGSVLLRIHTEQTKKWCDTLVL